MCPARVYAYTSRTDGNVSAMRASGAHASVVQADATPHEIVVHGGRTIPSTSSLSICGLGATSTRVGVSLTVSNIHGEQHPSHHPSHRARATTSTARTPTQPQGVSAITTRVLAGRDHYGLHVRVFRALVSFKCNIVVLLAISVC